MEFTNRLIRREIGYAISDTLISEIDNSVNYSSLASPTTALVIGNYIIEDNGDGLTIKTLDGTTAQLVVDGAIAQKQQESDDTPSIGG